MSYIGNNPRVKSIVSNGDTLANLQALPRVAGKLVYATDKKMFYFDNGNFLIALEKLGTWVVGTLAQVQAGEAHFTSLAAAQAQAAAGDKIVLKPMVLVENFTMSTPLYIEGEGHGSEIQGNISIGAVNGASIKNLRINGNLTLTAGSTNCLVTECWLSATGTASDSGTNNFYSLWQEV